MSFTVFSQRPMPTRDETIEIINRLVNRGIVTDLRTIPLAQERWSIGPVRGQCHDYAVTKQWLLAAHGITSQLCECVIEDGEHHLVLLVDGAALDNLTSQVGPMRYQVVRTQSAGDPDRWETP